ncbi:SAM-dependent methyltransferase RsmB/NOP2-type [Arabidopsis suecica]|uniref:SAM-dependent methyltransferase RsmB/NOP2-type n=1 Tax=Arabidopsis suecica TaxID=45249 RepID=A0A8T2DDP5_ARASU|nr:SAM-dependent methyltransferase RsmB/NOP2-type [Arabidopsis suecica]KAG7610448.1 SAM-dependent methyltransferase RsmB/NOP2-type [Arabidopsis suecica]
MVARRNKPKPPLVKHRFSGADSRKPKPPPATKQPFSGVESHKPKTSPATKQKFPGVESHKPKTPPGKQRFSGAESRKPKTPPATKQKFSSLERSALYARREAANILRTVLRGDAERRAVASIKSLVLSPSVRNKRGTFALVCETLKYLTVIKDVLEIANVLNSKWKRQEPLVFIVCYDILFGKDTPSIGDAEKFLMRHKDALLSGLATLLVRKKVESVDQLLGSKLTGHLKPRYVRVNTLKMDVDSAVQELEKHYTVQKDETIPDLLVLPPGSDLHAHRLVANGRIFLQGKASSMVAAALQPEAGWVVLDACSAPGNKTIHLAALMEGQGKIIACELNEERVKRLEHTIKLSGASNIEVCHGDFLGLNPKDPSFAKIRAILLDPSCSGSGTITDRLDHLLPSHSEDNNMNYDSMRLHKLAVFQKKALAHALSFPKVERVVYSTCSIHQIENEDVVSSVLPLASSLGFKLATPFPQWQRRGLPVFAGSEHLLRMDPVEDKEGFFIALFVRENKVDNPKSSELLDRVCRRRRKNSTMQLHPYLCPKMFRRWSGTLHRLKTRFLLSRNGC